MLEQLSSFIELQRHDIAVDELEQKALAFDPLIKKKIAEADALKTGLKTAKDTLTANTLKKKQLEAQVEEKQKLIQKHNGELNSLKSNDAYKAMLAEIQTAKNDIVSVEDQVLTVMEAIEAGDRKYKEFEAKLKSEEAALKAAADKLQSEKNAALAVAAKRKEERDVFAKTLPAPSVSQYESIRAKRDGVALVELRNNSCGGCHLTQTPYKINDIKKGKLVICESCTRIIYLKPGDSSTYDAAGVPNPGVKPVETPAAPTPTA